MFSLICVWINGWENNREAGDLRRYRTHYDVIVMRNWTHITNRDLLTQIRTWISINHDGVIKWKHFPRYWPFVRGIHRSPVNSPHKGQWRGALMFSLIWVWINSWVNNREAGDLRRYRVHCDVIVMISGFMWDVITYPYVDILIKLGHGWEITSHHFMKLWLLIHVLILMLVKADFSW